MNTEVWKTIDGFYGYEVSNMGRVRSFRRNEHGHILTECDDGRGYSIIGLLMCGSKKITKRVHSLVAAAFVENPNGYKEVNHKDANKKNNVASNLEWVTRAENINHAFGLNLIPRKTGSEHHNSRLVLDTQTGIYYDSVLEASLAKGYNQYTLAHRLNGSKKNKTSMIYV